MWLDPRAFAAPKGFGPAGGSHRYAARAGIGVGLCLQSTVIEDLASRRLVPLLFRFQAYDRSVYAVYPHRAYLPAKVRLFLDHLTAQLSTSPQDRAR